MMKQGPQGPLPEGRATLLRYGEGRALTVEEAEIWCVRVSDDLLCDNGSDVMAGMPVGAAFQWQGEKRARASLASDPL